MPQEAYVKEVSEGSGSQTVTSNTTEYYSVGKLTTIPTDQVVYVDSVTFAIQNFSSPSVDFSQNAQARHGIGVSYVKRNTYSNGLNDSGDQSVGISIGTYLYSGDELDIRMEFNNNKTSDETVSWDSIDVRTEARRVV